MLYRYDWLRELDGVFKKPYYKILYDKVCNDMYNKRTPELCADIHAPFNSLAFNDVKVVIMGIEPGYRDCDRTPYAFASANGKLSAKSKNFFREVMDEYDTDVMPPTDLQTWVKQGVLLVNSSLTCVTGSTLAHCNYWKPFMHDVLVALNESPFPIAFLLLGKQPAEVAAGIDFKEDKLVIKLPNPSPLSCYRGFLGSGCFKQINEFLISLDSDPIDWFRQQ